MAYVDQKVLIDLIVKMIRTKSVNPPGNELKLAEILESQLKNYGLDAKLIPIENERANVLGILKGKAKKPALLYNGHLDTVPLGSKKWRYDPFGGVVEGSRIYGRGASDMKGGLAAMIIAVGLLSSAKVELDGDLIIAATSGEEVDSVGARHLLDCKELRDVGALVISEPTDNHLYIAEKGAIWIRVSTFGRTAHGSKPDLGVNAILHMNTFINKLTDLHLSDIQHWLCGKTTMNVSTIKGGNSVNMIPDKCILEIDIRTVPGVKHKDVVEKIRNICAEISNSISDFHCSIDILNDRIPIETDANSEIVKTALSTAEEILKRRVVPEGTSYYTDASVLVADTGLPMIIFGPGNPKIAHQTDEYIEISKVIEAVRFYISLAVAYL